LARKAKPSLGIHRPKSINADEINALHGGHFTEINVTTLNRSISSELTQHAARKTICRLKVLIQKISLQRNKIETHG
jgi:hypothetical protein